MRFQPAAFLFTIISVASAAPMSDDLIARSDVHPITRKSINTRASGANGNVVFTVTWNIEEKAATAGEATKENTVAQKYVDSFLKIVAIKKTTRSKLGIQGSPKKISVRVPKLAHKLKKGEDYDFKVYASQDGGKPTRCTKESPCEGFIKQLESGMWGGQLMHEEDTDVIYTNIPERT